MPGNFQEIELVAPPRGPATQRQVGSINPLALGQVIDVPATIVNGCIRIRIVFWHLHASSGGIKAFTAPTL